MMKKIFLAEQIVPGKIYLIDDLPVIFCCSKETGWLRGHLRLSDFRTTGAGYMATGNFTYLGHPTEHRVRSFELLRKKIDEPWVIQLKRITECNSDWVDKQIKVAESRLATAKRYLEDIQKIKQGLI